MITPTHFRPIKILSEIFGIYSKHLLTFLLLTFLPVLARGVSILSATTSSLVIVRILNGLTLFLAFVVQLVVLIYAARLKENPHLKVRFAEIYSSVFSSFASLVWILILTFLSLLGGLTLLFLIIGIVAFLFSSYGSLATIVVNQLDSVLTIVGSIYYVLFGYSVFAFVQGRQKGVKALLTVWVAIRMRAARVFVGFLFTFFVLAIILAIAGILSGLIGSTLGIAGEVIAVLLLQAISSMLIAPIGALLLAKLYSDFSVGLPHLSLPTYDRGRFIIAALSSTGVAAILVLMFVWKISPFGWLLISF